MPKLPIYDPRNAMGVRERALFDARKKIRKKEPIEHKAPKTLAEAFKRIELLEDLVYALIDEVQR